VPATCYLQIDALKILFPAVTQANYVPISVFRAFFPFVPRKWDKFKFASPTVGQFGEFFIPKPGWRG
jgi:hypothetical protein